jgi:hypothetical protein
MRELKFAKILERIQILKQSHRWSFQQIKKHKAVVREKTLWDSLLEEMVVFMSCLGLATN